MTSRGNKDDKKHWTIMYQYKNTAPRVIRINNLSTFGSKAALFFAILFFATIIGKVINNQGSTQPAELATSPAVTATTKPAEAIPASTAEPQAIVSAKAPTKMEKVEKPTEEITSSPAAAPKPTSDFITPIPILAENTIEISRLKITQKANTYDLSFRVQRAATSTGDARITGNIAPVFTSFKDGFSAISYGHAVNDQATLNQLMDLDFFSFKNFVDKTYTFQDSSVALQTMDDLALVFRIDGKMQKKIIKLNNLKIERFYTQKGENHENL